MTSEEALRQHEISNARLAIVTPTNNRRALLERLHSSLTRQTSYDFTWVVVDDASTDTTAEWIGSLVANAPFPIRVLSNRENRGKCASLNRVFREVVAEFYLVVDSDDKLLSSAVNDVREKVDQYADAPNVGALFFAYSDESGSSLRPYEAEGDIVLTRAQHDARFEKYDGGVGYYRRTIQRYRYPEFPGESYIGPTVLQLRMAPEYAICFCVETVGVAEYQDSGLTAAGRALRVKNPLGMMEYTRLIAAQSPSWRTRTTYAAMYEAYRQIAGMSRDQVAERELVCEVRGPFITLLGRVLGSHWQRKYRESA